MVQKFILFLFSFFAGKQIFWSVHNDKSNFWSKLFSFTQTWMYSSVSGAPWRKFLIVLRFLITQLVLLYENKTV